MSAAGGAPPKRWPALRRLSRECGLVRPGKSWLAWLGDPHVVAAILAAVPVWVGLGLTIGVRMREVAGWSAWISFLLVQPIVEELVFRGLLQGRLLDWTGARKAGPATLANLMSAGAFAALHLLSQPLAWALAVAVPALVFGHMRERFASVLPAMVLHIVYNTGFALTAWWVHR